MDNSPGNESTVLALFQKQIERSPHKVAVTDGNQSLTFLELDARSNRLARYLALKGLVPGFPVGMCLERSVEVSIAILAIMKAGGVYMPLDVHWPELRLQVVVKNSGAGIILTQRGLKQKFANFPGKLILVDDDGENINSETDESVGVSLQHDSPAYIIHTSGSTGEPKGVVLMHGPLANLINWHTDFLKVDGEKTLGFTAYTFDVSIQEFFSTCCTGGCYYIASDDIRLIPEKLVRFVFDYEIERFFMPFTPLAHFIKAAEDSSIQLDELRTIITAGEALVVTRTFREFFSRHPDCSLRNQYGPTEAHIIVTDYELTGPPEHWPERPPIGTPVANVKIHILDEESRLLPENETGELFLAGVCPAKGYLNQPELTQEKFLPDPFSDTDSAKMYRTGDRGRLLPDGNIEYLGRSDLQVKIRGFRIELTEIETVLMEHPGIKLAVVQVFEEASRTKQLVAYLTARDGHVPGIFELRSFIAARLPDYMLPHSFVFMDKFPMTENGKLDRKALPKPGKPVSHTDYAPPENDTQSRLISIWQDVLKLDKVGVNDNFFVLGGDSLLAAQILVRMEAEFDIDISLAELYASPTASALSVVVLDKDKNKEEQQELLLKQLLDEVEGMSEAEINAQLSNLNQ